jgi:hypothetical protein
MAVTKLFGEINHGGVHSDNPPNYSWTTFTISSPEPDQKIISGWMSLPITKVTKRSPGDRWLEGRRRFTHKQEQAIYAICHVLSGVSLPLYSYEFSMGANILNMALVFIGIWSE